MVGWTALLRGVALAGMAGLFLGATCRAHFCSGDECDDDEQDEGSRSETILFTPLPAPFGAPVGLLVFAHSGETPGSRDGITSGPRR